MKKNTIILMVLTIFSSLLGFFREILLSYFYGASNISDAYLISMTIPIVIFSFIGTGIATGFIPLYSKIKSENGEVIANNFVNNLINILIILCGGIAILGILFTESIVKVFASGFSNETLDIAVNFSRITILGIFFPGLIYIYNGFLQMRGEYTIPALTGLPNNVIIGLSIIISYFISIMFLPIGLILASVIQLILLFPIIRRTGYKYRFNISLKDKHIVKMAYVVAPLIISVSVNQINTLIDRTLASQIAVGGISALNYANKLNGFIQAIFILSISTVIYPVLSTLAAERKMREIRVIISKTITIISAIVIPISIGMMIYSDQIITLLFGRGAFDNFAVSMTSDAFFYYSIGLFGLGIGQILSKVFYSLQDTKTPMISAIISMIANIILNIVLSKYMGISGLALATSIAGLIFSGFLFIRLHTKYKLVTINKVTSNLLKILFASFIFALILIYINGLLLNHLISYVSMTISMFLGIIAYTLTVYHLKINEINELIIPIKRIFKK